MLTPKTWPRLRELDFTQEKPMPLSLAEFVERWKAVNLTERSAGQSHFIDLCEILGQPHPAAADPNGDTFTFEKHVSTLLGRQRLRRRVEAGLFCLGVQGQAQGPGGRIQTTRRLPRRPRESALAGGMRHGHFRGPYQLHRDAPQRLPLHLDDLLTGAPTANCALPPLEVLRALFTDPEKLRPEAAAARVTEQAAAEFSKLAASLRARGVDSERAAHFLMRLLFCLFADSIGLLPENLFRKMLN